jgi:pyridinium-3,5-bisthiocarboxylic acid mononucleotide nickel chelatase
MEIHLDLLGGMSGDMFIAAMLDAFPQHEPRVNAPPMGG